MYKLSTKLGLVTFATLVALVSIACNQGGSGSGSGTDNTVAATVNGKSIMLAEVEKLISAQTQGQQTQLSPLQLAQARLQVLDSLIQREVLYQRAQKENVLPNDEQITTAISQQQQQSGMTTEEFQKQLKEQGLTLEVLRDEARKQIAVKNLQEKYNGKITISDREVEDYYNGNRQQFVNARGIALAMIAVDPADNSGQGIRGEDAKSETDAKLKIDNIYQQLKSGADFASVARVKSEDVSWSRGGDIGFATEDDLKGTGFPQELITQFFGPLQVGSFTAPVKFSAPQYPGGRWYIFKLQERRLQNENLTLESPGVNGGPSVRQQITQALVKAQQDILNGALLVVAMSEAKVVNNLALTMLNTPSNLGLRPASREGATPAASPAAPAGPSPAANATTAPAAKASPK